MSNQQQGSQFGQGSHKDNPGSGQHGEQRSGQQPQHQQQQDPQKSGQHGNPGQQGGGVPTPKQGDMGRK